MTRQAAVAVVGDSPLGPDPDVGVVARHTPQLLRLGAALEATAAVHLLDVVDGLPIATGCVGGDEDRPERIQGEPRAEIVQPSTLADNPGDALEVALLADRLAETPAQFAGVDYVEPIQAPDVPLSGPMTALAADGVAGKDRRFVAVLKTIQ